MQYASNELWDRISNYIAFSQGKYMEWSQDFLHPLRFKCDSFSAPTTLFYLLQFFVCDKSTVFSSV